MTIQDLGSLGEFIGSIGVICSLVYLAIQIKRDSAQTALQTKAIYATAFQNLIDHHTALQMDMISDERLREAVRKARDDPEAMSAEDVQLYYMFSTQQMRSFYNAYHLYASGLIGEEQWKVFEGNIRRVVRSRRFDDFWKRAQLDYPEEFRVDIDGFKEKHLT